jgi:hypothetical protein
MATTTNYGWTTPDDTALVKDGAAAIRTLGSSVDTTTKALNPSTTLGDIEYRSSTANTNTRLGIGTTGQVLTVAGGVPSWATSTSGSLTSIASGSLSGAAVTLSSISGSYKSLKLQLFGFSLAANGPVLFRVNGASGATDYSYAGFTSVATSQSSNGEFGLYPSPSNIVATSTNSFYELDFRNYTSTNTNKSISWTGYITNTDFTSGIQIFGAGGYRSTSAITSISIETSGTTFDAGTYILYGVN